MITRTCRVTKKSYPIVVQDWEANALNPYKYDLPYYKPFTGAVVGNMYANAIIPIVDDDLDEDSYDYDDYWEEDEYPEDSDEYDDDF